MDAVDAGLKAQNGRTPASNGSAAVLRPMQCHAEVV